MRNAPQKNIKLQKQLYGHLVCAVALKNDFGYQNIILHIPHQRHPVDIKRNS